jgi:hypothetical protein
MSTASTSSTSLQTFVQRNKQAILLGAAAVLVVAGGIAYSSYSTTAPRPASPKSGKGKKSKTKGTTATPPAGEKDEGSKATNDVVQDGQSYTPLLEAW